MFLLQDGSDFSSTPSTLSPVGCDINEEQGDEWDLKLSQSTKPEEQGDEWDLKLSQSTKPELSNKSSKAIIKSVCGKILSRDECVKLLTSKFSVQARNITSLTPSQLLQVVSKKLVRGKYVTLAEAAGTSELKKDNIKVNKEIEL